MILTEIGSPIGFELKKILHGSQKLKNDDHPESIFFFNKIYCGECNFRIDKDKEVFCISILIIDYFEGKFKLDPMVIQESIADVIDEEFGDQYQIVVMSDWEVDHYDTEYHNYKFY